jgi:CoA-transferase family III
LTGVRVVDCTTVVLGPWAAQQLGDLGADVVKIEPPEGDTTRQLGPMRNPDMGAFYLAVNRNKRSIRPRARCGCPASRPRTARRRRPSAGCRRAWASTAWRSRVRLA